MFFSCIYISFDSISINPSEPCVLTILAGTPTTVTFSSLMLFVTTAFAPTAILSASVISPMILAPLAIKTLSPIFGAF